jgi:hypothetical protein
VPEFSEALRRASRASHAKREIAVEFVCDQAPEAAHLPDAFDDEAGIAAQFRQPMRAVPKIIVRLFVQAE